MAKLSRLSSTVLVYYVLGAPTDVLFGKVAYTG
jgi:hypothetical protein